MTGRSNRILVLDDSRPYLDFMRILLSTEGFEVVTAFSVQSARCQLAQQRFDLIITDALLPGLAPFGILDELQQNPAAAGLPILLCSGAVRELRAARNRLEQQGVALMEKPFDVDDLLTRVGTLLSRDGHTPHSQDLLG